MSLTDSEFIAHLRDYLTRFSEGRKPVVPPCWDDGKLLRDETLKLPCYAGFDNSVAT